MPVEQSGGDAPARDSGRALIFLSILWIVAGALLFVAFALVAFALNPFATGSLFEPEEYRTLVLLWHVPMAWGWVPAAYLSARGIPRPWRHAKRIVLWGICAGPALFLTVMLVWRWYAQASASI